jgi:hypothetical protein
VTSTSSPPEEVAREPSSTVFVSDPSAEAEKIAQTLRGAGYVVVDVPMSMLIARVAVQRPRVILVDADTEGALDAVGRLRELPDAEGIDIVFLGKEGVALSNVEDAMAHEGSGFFTRPVDIPALARKIESLTGGPSRDEPPRASTPPPSLPSQRPSIANLPPASMRAGPERPSSRPPSRPPGPTSQHPQPATQDILAPSHATQSAREAARRVVSLQTPLSRELETLLAEAEQRIGTQSMQDVLPPSPEEEIEAVLPAEILSSLDEPIDEEDEDDLEMGRGQGGDMHGSGAPGPITSAGRNIEQSEPGDSSQAKTHGGPHGSVTTGTRAGPSIIDTGHRVDTGPSGFLTPQRDTGGGSISPITSGTGSAPLTSSAGAPPFTGASGAPFPGSMGGDLAAVSDRVSSGPPTEYGEPPRGGQGSQLLSSTLGSLQGGPELPGMFTSGQPASLGRSQKAESVPPPAQVPSVLGPNDGPLVIARAIALRATGALCIESPEGVRRAVIREGDLVTAASGVDSESLLAFLGARGDLPREVVQQLAGKVPPFGRHAGAALVAHGHLRQDQLWNVLRAHAEWILGRAMLVARGTALIEPEPPGRLRGEPSVFGGSTGAEVLVEVVRRVIAPSEAIERLGGVAARIGEGESASLLSECALDAEERDLVGRMLGATVGEIVQVAAEADFASVVYALALLGVVDVIRSVGPSRATGQPATGNAAPSQVEPDALDDEAIRARVRARIQLVDEGDYFALLGLSREATGYEVRRAFLELRRVFEPSRILTPRIADLADDVRKIANVLEEAYEILRDNVRRERYRRAIAEGPRA